MSIPVIYKHNQDGKLYEFLVRAKFDILPCVVYKDITTGLSYITAKNDFVRNFKIYHFQNEDSVCTSKICRSCKQIKLLSDFYKKLKSGDSYASSCKKCQSVSKHKKNIRIFISSGKK